ncbi:hydrogenase maturation nickel metallochaperone HypA [Vibrio sp. HA2012]|uniref:hydrogenase maturation nickel metallochaperone HypA n=1 Tax=Vibrio sp. HA2012 TaxID=1971595 RepID=UPI000C2C4BE4|nr:hydrogenase maturation nickel metallochaperone HypA [Vibrio sp. HA2012]PJC87735.1 hydrogenase maturation nickel metallochaperone HypA [Vibrio sp. HA2012]
MHEMSLCESLIRIIEQQAEAEQFDQVKAIYLDIGALAGVEPGAMYFCFDVICRGTIADSAKLIIRSLPLQAYCLTCGKTVSLSDRFSPCPHCGTYHLEYQGGDEMQIRQLEVY